MTSKESTTELNRIALEDDPEYVYGAGEYSANACLQIDLREENRPARLFIEERHSSNTGTPPDVWHKQILQWRGCAASSAVPDGSAMAALMEALKPHIETIRADSETDIVWDGNNNVGRLGPKSLEASDKIEEILHEYDWVSRTVTGWEVEEWLGDWEYTPGQTAESIVNESRRDYRVVLVGGLDAVRKFLSAARNEP